jgi:translation initiation factor IF-3
MQHKDLAIGLAKRFVADVADEGHAEGEVGKMTGKSMIIFIIPGNDKPKVKKLDSEKDHAENDSES